MSLDERSAAGEEKTDAPDLLATGEHRVNADAVEDGLPGTVITQTGAVSVDVSDFSLTNDADALRIRLTNLLGPEALNVQQELSVHANGSPERAASVDAALSVIFKGRQACVDQVRPIFFDNAALKRLVVTNGKYFVRKLGQGKFGTVVLVFDRNAPPETALRVMKVLHTPVTEYDERDGRWYTDSDEPTVLANIARFNRDAQAHAVLGDPAAGVAPQLLEKGAVSWEDGRLHPFITMRYVPGHTVSAWMQAAHKHGPVPLPLVADMGALYAMQLARAHERRFVHRDLSPGNLYIPDAAMPIVLDWGLSVEPTGTDRFTQQHTIMGTPNYMSPELASNAADVSYPSDVYQLAAVLYHLKMGRPLFDGNGAANGKLLMALVQQHLTQIPNLSDFGWFAPKELTAAFARALEKDPQRRQSMGDLAEQLYAVSNLRQRSGKSFARFMDGDLSDALHMLPIPPELQREREELERDQPIPSWYAKPRGADRSPPKNGGVEAMVDFHLRESAGDIRHGTRRKVWRVMGWGGAALAGATFLGLTIAGAAKLLGTNGTDVTPVQPTTPNQPVPGLVQGNEKPSAPKPRSVLVELDERGHIREAKLFAGTAAEIALPDKETVAFTRNGNVRAMVTNLSGTTLAKLLGYEGPDQIPQAEFRDGQPAMVFLGDDGRWVLAINSSMGYVVGKPEPDKLGRAGTVYSEREDLKGFLGKQKFTLAQHSADYLADPDLGDIIREMPMLECGDPAGRGLFGNRRDENMVTMNTVVEQLRNSLRVPAKR